METEEQEEERAAATLERMKKAMRSGARLDVVRLLLNPVQKWGVVVYERGTTRGGNDKWVKIPTIIVPQDDETVADVLAMLGGFAEEAD